MSISAKEIKDNFLMCDLMLKTFEQFHLKYGKKSTLTALIILTLGVLHQYEDEEINILNIFKRNLDEEWKTPLLKDEIE